MGKQFGNLQKLKGFTYYVLSPYELNPFKGVLNPGFPNFIRKIYSNIFYIGVPFTLAFMVYDYGTTEYERLNRKNPDDYKDDV